MNIRIEQNAIKQAGGWWDWSIWLEGSGVDLDQVESAEYILHPTFPDPVKELTNKDENFRLDARGWGEFMVHVNLHMKDGSIVKHDHWLKLREGSYTAPTKTAEFSFEPSSQRRLYLSCSLVDLQFAEEISAELESNNIQVLMSDDFDPELPLDKAISLESEPINGAIFLFSDIHSPYVNIEAQIMRQHRIAILPVLIGPESKLPEGISDLEPIRIKDRAEVAGITLSILDQLIMKR